MFTHETKLAHPTKNPVFEVTGKVKHTENQKDYEITSRSKMFKCDLCELKYKKNSESYGHQALEQIFLTLTLY